MEYWQLKQRQSLPLQIKVILSQQRIKSWYSHWHGDVYVSFSGGKDSTVLLYLVRELFPNVPAVFVNTGLEYPEIVDFVKTIDNVVWLKPSIPFNKVIDVHGYPVVSKENSQKINEIRNTKSNKLKDIRMTGGEKGNGKLPDKWKYLIHAPFKISDRCCHIMKKHPVKKYEKEFGLKPFIGNMASDSRLRTTAYLENGCNAFNSNRPVSTPIAFWKEGDIWGYIKENNIPYSKIYDMGYPRTGCMFCMFGAHLETTPNRFQRMAKTHPKQYDYCINKLGCGKVLDYIGVPYSGYVEENALFNIGEYSE